MDISSYARSKSMTWARVASGSKFKEVAPAECTGAPSSSLTQHLLLLGLLQGSFFVTRRAETFLTGQYNQLCDVLFLMILSREASSIDVWNEERHRSYDQIFRQDDETWL